MLHSDRAADAARMEVEMRMVSALLLSGLVIGSPTLAKGIRPGQYSIGGVQQICLKADGTWYGTTFNFGGHWINNPGTLHTKAAIYGTYQIQGHAYDGHG